LINISFIVNNNYDLPLVVLQYQGISGHIFMRLQDLWQNQEA